ncbi:unnamed protein product [Aphanomyces euteiches]
MLRPWRVCEHEYLAGITIGELCFWMDEEDPTPSTSTPRYNVWAAVYCWETTPLYLSKLCFRSLLTTYVLYLLWTKYYRHYVVLMQNLRCVGLGQEYVHYQIILGDPGYAILTDPFVSMAMMLDIWCGAPYMIMAVLRVSQFHDLWQYALGCIYLSRTVWFAYVCMRGLSALVKWRRWERSFVPVDPGFLAISAYIYGGPLTSLFFTTPVVLVFSRTWGTCLSEEYKDEAIEGILGRPRQGSTTTIQFD